jgi:hypothetical protein
MTQYILKIRKVRLLRLAWLSGSLRAFPHSDMRNLPQSLEDTNGGL